MRGTARQREKTGKSWLRQPNPVAFNLLVQIIHLSSPSSHSRSLSLFNRAIPGTNARYRFSSRYVPAQWCMKFSRIHGGVSRIPAMCWRFRPPASISDTLEGTLPPAKHRPAKEDPRLRRVTRDAHETGRVTHYLEFDKLTARIRFLRLYKIHGRVLASWRRVKCAQGVSRANVAFVCATRAQSCTPSSA